MGTETELRAAAGIIGYEWTMLLGVQPTTWHLGPPEPRSPTWIANDHSRRELTLLHTRTLYEFLFGEGKHDDDIIACDFLEGKEATDWKGNTPRLKDELCPWITANYGELNKRLFHLSYVRNQKALKWEPDPPEIIRELVAAFTRFRSKLTEAKGRLFDEGITSESDGPFEFLPGCPDTSATKQ